jgi:AcrR family transcriptional regulator
MESLPPEVPAEEGLGLRARKKLATRQALQRAALALAADRGPDVTVEEICAAADLSVRTFHNYFSSKDEAIIGETPSPPPDHLLATFEAGGPTGDLLADLRDTLLPHLQESLPSLKEMHLRHRVLEANPDLARQFFASFMTIEQRLTVAAARRLGTDPSDPRTQAVGTIATAGMRLAVRRWMNSGGKTSIDREMTTVFDALDDVFADVKHKEPT